MERKKRLAASIIGITLIISLWVVTLLVVNNIFLTLLSLLLFVICISVMVISFLCFIKPAKYCSKTTRKVIQKVRDVV